MTLNNIQIISIETKTLSAWLNAGGDIPSLPVSSEVCTLWLTLSGKGIVSSKTFNRGELARVVVVHQSGYFTSPGEVWPVLEQFVAVTRSQKTGLYLVLTGGETFMGHLQWIRHLSLHTPGEVLSRKLIIPLLARSLLRYEGWIVRLLRKILRRGR